MGHRKCQDVCYTRNSLVVEVRGGRARSTRDKFYILCAICAKIKDSYSSQPLLVSKSLIMRNVRLSKCATPYKSVRQSSPRLGSREKGVAAKPA